MRRAAAMALATLALVSGCGVATDPATRLAFDLEAGAGRLDRGAAARFVVEHRTPSRRGECEGPYTVQLDAVGAIVFWCRDDAGAVVSSHSTSWHRRFVDTPRTWLVEKAAGSTLVVALERSGSSVRVVDVR